ncbi:hypothetical protein GE061_013401 [Apolygus lucorum]|uniref:CCHC-type domain-containing protein n=1 Tax=Apolygus lucorum TaxID=248454 RepID=A0A8S9XMV9_APOLU|nr:hypothetical protein GE061_013401 [Apolygus lucorum]
MSSSVPPFAEGDNITSFLDRLELFLFAEGITEDPKMIGKLTSLLPLPLFDRLKAAIAPAQVISSKYSTVRSKLISLESPPVNKALSRFQFSALGRAPSQSVSDFASALKKAVLPCEFGAAMETFLCERFVGGMKDSQIVGALLALPEGSSFDVMVAAAVKAEAVKEAMELLCHPPPTPSVAALHQEPSWRTKKEDPQRKKTTWSRRGPFQAHGPPPPTGSSYPHGRNPAVQRAKKLCNGCHVNHHPAECPARTWLCNQCGTRGHIQRFCPNRNTGQHKNFFIAEPNSYEPQESQLENNEDPFGALNNYLNCNTKGSPVLVDGHPSLDGRGVSDSTLPDCGSTVGSRRIRHFSPEKVVNQLVNVNSVVSPVLVDGHPSLDGRGVSDFKLPDCGSTVGSRRIRHFSPVKFEIAPNQHAEDESEEETFELASEEFSTCFAIGDPHPTFNFLLASCAKMSHEKFTCPEPLFVKFSINQSPLVPFLVDSGSSITLMDSDTIFSLLPDLVITPLHLSVSTASASHLAVTGVSNVQLSMEQPNNTSIRVKLFIASRLSPSAILGRDILQVLNPNWAKALMSPPVTCSLNSL